MTETKLIQAMPVERDEQGQWHHPDMPFFDEGDADGFQEWLDQQGLECRMVTIEDDLPSDSRLLEMIANDEPIEDLTGWEPTPPEGDGWFVFAIAFDHDGEATCWWMRHKGEVQ